MKKEDRKTYDKLITKLIKFTERSKGLDLKEKIKLILFLQEIKPNAEIILKTGSKNLGEKYEFERLMVGAGILFSVSKPKSYEEIKKIKVNKIIWELEGTYHYYDLFKNEKTKKEFNKYLKLLNKRKYSIADKIVGKHYGYPRCCVERFIKEKDEKFLKKNYSYLEYYKKQQDIDRKFPFLFHRPHSLTCKKSIQLNKQYGQIINKISKKVYKEYLSKSKFKGNLIIGGLSDVEINGKSIWSTKKGYEYEIILKKPFRKHYYLLSFLSKKKYELGQVLKGEVIFHQDYAKVKILKEKKRIIEGIRHERKLPLLGEVTIR